MPMPGLTRLTFAQAFKEKGLDYDKQKASFAGYEIGGMDPLCKKPIKNPREGGEVWIEGGAITAYSSADCTLAGGKESHFRRQEDRRGFRVRQDVRHQAVRGQGVLCP